MDHRIKIINFLEVYLMHCNLHNEKLIYLDKSYYMYYLFKLSLYSVLFFLLLACNSGHKSASTDIDIKTLEGKELYLALCEIHQVPDYKNATFGFVANEPYGYNAYLKTTDAIEAIQQFYTSEFSKTDWEKVDFKQEGVQPLHYIRGDVQVTVMPTSDGPDKRIISIRWVDSKTSADRIREMMKVVKEWSVFHDLLSSTKYSNRRRV